MRDGWVLLMLSMRRHLGRRYWILPPMVLIWPLAYFGLTATRLIPLNLDASNAQNWLVGLPLYVLAIGLGIGIIASEIEQRTLEVSYTLPNGPARVWTFKLLATTLLLLIAQIMIIFSVLITGIDVPILAWFRVFQGAMFFLVFAMSCGVWLRNKLSAALVSGCVLGFMMAMGFDNRWSPIFNPLAARYGQSEALPIWSVQNHIGFILLTLALAALSYARAERRELLLGD